MLSVNAFQLDPCFALKQQLPETGRHVKCGGNVTRVLLEPLLCLTTWKLDVNFPSISVSLSPSLYICVCVKWPSVEWSYCL